MDGAALIDEGTATGALSALVDDLVATRAMMGALQAHEMNVLAAAALVAELSRVPSTSSREAELPLRSVSAEIGAALRVSDRSVQRQLTDATLLTSRFPRTLEALRDGRISRAHATVIVDAAVHLDDRDARSAYEANVIPYAEVESATRLKSIARVRAEQVAPSSLPERHGRARGRRHVRVVDVDDGMCELVALLPAMIGHGVHDRLTALAHEVRRAADSSRGSDRSSSADAPAERGNARSGGASCGPADEPPARDDRSMDELRADLLADLLLAADPIAHNVPTGSGAVRATVQITIPALTLLGRGTDPADLAGYGPIDAETARGLAGHAPGWDRVLTHPVSGCVLAVDRYRPSEHIRRALRVRDRHCRFVGCRQPVHRCDLDHSQDAAKGGTTDAWNLAHLCRRHHILKHHTRWRVTQLPDGVLEWVSPTGRVYRDVPVTSVAFRPAGDAWLDNDPSRDPDPPPF
ncbi:HNH endonuclease signature motif containing protein [Microbacterium sp.]|uniref:HNH endonuclease signature motif containing protein n=1 Tax=Microbacterium sp. TaxID=51671 RepID=UPI00092AB2CE|nr:HNH endonuclease signature motif containing protein [Microbacterium sp.]MBN9190548.1 DUF222 domain-containing protein [Microbacterium sp.]MBN9191434.1 DUF222 domain-containing protein [Microbacterium sp.]OJU69861.1 MAG: hypothetical protein BGO04_06895 [Microbacterium sp. 70-38]